MATERVLGTWEQHPLYRDLLLAKVLQPSQWRHEGEAEALFPWEKFALSNCRYALGMVRNGLRLLVGLFAFLALGYGSDWAAWQLRGKVTGLVMVSREVVAPLKGGREEYYFDGTVPEACSKSMLPEGGMRACWWLERHRVVFDR